MADGSPTVLVVEDDIDTRTALREFLEEEGLEVTVAGSGAEAINCLCQAERPYAKGRQSLMRSTMVSWTWPTLPRRRFRFELLLEAR